MNRVQMDEIIIENIKVKAQNIHIPKDISVQMISAKIIESQKVYKVRKGKVILHYASVTVCTIIAMGLLFFVLSGQKGNEGNQEELRTTGAVVTNPNATLDMKPGTDMPILSRKELTPVATDYEQMHEDMSNRLMEVHPKQVISNDYIHKPTYYRVDMERNEGFFGEDATEALALFIDERADIKNTKKMDGDYLYLLEYDDKIRIVDVSGNLPFDISVIDLAREWNGILVQDFHIFKDKLIVLHYQEYWNTLKDDADESHDLNAHDDGHMLWKEILDNGEENDFRDYLIAMLYDISDKTSPVLEKVYRQEGLYKSSMISDEGVLFLISACELKTGALVADCVPVIDGESMSTDDIYIADDEGIIYTIISTLDIKRTFKLITRKAFLANTERIHITASDIYLMIEKWDGDMSTRGLRYTRFMHNTTQIIKLSYKDGMISDITCIYLRGKLIKQFLSGDGHLAVLLFHRPLDKENELVNELYILDEQLDIIGSLPDITNGERTAREYGTMNYIKNTAFTGYIVDQEGSLYSVDFSDYSHIKKSDKIDLSEFELSRRNLYMLSQHLLLSINGVNDGFHINIIDISNPLDVKVADELRLYGETCFYNDYFSDLKIMIDQRDGTFGFNVWQHSAAFLNMYFWENDADIDYINKKNYMIFRYTKEEGIQIKKRQEILRIDYRMMDWEKCVDAFYDSSEDLTKVDKKHTLASVRAWRESGGLLGYSYMDFYNEKSHYFYYNNEDTVRRFHWFYTLKWIESPYALSNDLMYTEGSEAIYMNHKILIITKNRGIYVLDRNTHALLKE